MGGKTKDKEIAGQLRIPGFEPVIQPPAAAGQADEPWWFRTNFSGKGGGK